VSYRGVLGTYFYRLVHVDWGILTNRPGCEISNQDFWFIQVHMPFQVSLPTATDKCTGTSTTPTKPNETETTTLNEIAKRTKGALGLRSTKDPPPNPFAHRLRLIKILYLEVQK
jgi:hypothetical protein